MIAELTAPIETPAIQSRHLSRLRQRLVGAGLIGAERAAALQYEHGLLVELCHDDPDMVRPRPAFKARQGLFGGNGLGAFGLELL